MQVQMLIKLIGIFLTIHTKEMSDKKNVKSYQESKDFKIAVIMNKICKLFLNYRLVPNIQSLRTLYYAHLLEYFLRT